MRAKGNSTYSSLLVKLNIHRPISDIATSNGAAIDEGIWARIAAYSPLNDSLNKCRPIEGEARRAINQTRETGHSKGKYRGGVKN